MNFLVVVAEGGSLKPIEVPGAGIYSWAKAQGFPLYGKSLMKGLEGMPIFEGLAGPMSSPDHVARYETAAAYELMSGGN